MRNMAAPERHLTQTVHSRLVVLYLDSARKDQAAVRELFREAQIRHHVYQISGSTFARALFNGLQYVGNADVAALAIALKGPSDANAASTYEG